MIVYLLQENKVQPKFLFRSLASLRVNLKNMRIATTQKIKAEYDRRVQTNADAVDTLQANFSMWNQFEGPHFKQLKDPSDEALDRLHDINEQLQHFISQEHAGCDGGLDIAKECMNAINSISSLNYDRIRREKFPLTPEMLYEGLLKNLRDLKTMAVAEDSRREHWLTVDATDVVGEIHSHYRSGPDRFGCDPDAFARPTSSHKPHHWAVAVQKASLVPDALGFSCSFFWLLLLLL